MAVGPEFSSRDMYLADLLAHDERVARDGWVYYVRGVKRRWQLLHGEDDGRGAGWKWVVIMGLWNTIMRALDRRRPWLLGVVRLGDVATWNDIRARIVHVEPLRADEDLSQGVARLVAAASAGRFSPE